MTAFALAFFVDRAGVKSSVSLLDWLVEVSSLLRPLLVDEEEGYLRLSSARGLSSGGTPTSISAGGPSGPG